MCRLSGRDEDLEAPPVGHGLVAGGDAVEVGGGVEDLPGLDGAVEDRGHQFLDVRPDRGRSADEVRNGGDERGEDELVAEADRIARARAASGTPFVFPGLPSAITGPHDDVVLWGPGVAHDWELELGVVIGRPAHRIAPQDAMDVVAGYVIGNDVSTRDVMNRPDLPMTDFVMTKSRPTFFPIGRCRRGVVALEPGQALVLALRRHWVRARSV